MFWPVFFGASSFTLLLFIAWATLVEDLEWDKEKFSIAAAGVIFGPLGLFALFAVVIYYYTDERRKIHCAKIMTIWEHLAAKDNIQLKNWQWFMDDKAKEERYNLLRTKVGELRQKDLELLVSTPDETFKIDQPLRDAIAHELVEREILK
jgi:hypothetical protein